MRTKSFSGRGQSLYSTGRQAGNYRRVQACQRLRSRTTPVSTLRTDTFACAMTLPAGSATGQIQRCELLAEQRGRAAAASK